MALSFDRLTKVIEVPITDTEITIQALLNESRDYQDELAILDMRNMINCYGKQPLGGGVMVGLTAELLDGWQIKFADRPGPGYVQCSVTGGNLIAYDDVGTEQFPLTPSDFVFATITASSSATLSELSAIQYASFGGGVTIDVIDGVSGTAYPIGTIESPVDNLADAVSIANTRGFMTLYINETMTLGGGIDITDFSIVGRSRVKTIVTIDASALCDGIHINNCTVDGLLDGNVQIDNCNIGELLYVYGQISNSALFGTIELAGGAVAHLTDCSTLDPNSIPAVDMGGTGQDIFLADWSGGIKFRNMTGDQKIGVQIDGGRVMLEPTISAGFVGLTGTGELYDSSTGTVNISSSGLMSKATIGEAVHEEIGEEIQYASFGGQVTIDPVGGSAGTTYPIGTIENPVDNIVDALLIAADHGFHNLYFNKGMTIAGVDITDYTIVGASNVHTQIIIDASSVSDGITVKNCDLSGTINGKIKIHDCMIGDLVDVSGYIFNSSLYGTITLGGGADSNIANCFLRRLSQIPAIDMGGSGQNLFLSDWSGAMKVRNMSGPTNSIGFQLDGGRVFIEPTVSAGMVGIVGIGEVVDQSTGTVNVDITGLINNDAISNDIWDAQTSEHTDLGSFGESVGSGSAGEKDWTAGERSQIRDALGVSGTKVKSTGGLLQKVKAGIDAIISFVS